MAKHRRLKTLIAGTIATGGVFSVAGWSAAAHGNRSSHEVAEIRWNLEDYVVNRQLVLSGSTEATAELERALTRSEVARLKGGVPVETSPDAHEQAVQSMLQVTPMTHRVLNFLAAGDRDRAISGIEQLGDPNIVLKHYIYFQLDLHNLGVTNGKTTNKYVPEILSISRAGIAYAKSLPQTPTVRHALAGLLNNVASFTLPDTGNVTTDQRETGRQAALGALQIWSEIGDPRAIARAHWLVGAHFAKAGDTASAAAHFRSGLAAATAAGDLQEAAWHKLYLATVTPNKADARKLAGEAVRTFRQGKNSFGLDEVKSLGIETQ